MADATNKFISWFKGTTVVGVLGLVAAVIWFTSIQIFLASATRVEGTIINIARELDSEAHYTYTPEVQYTDQNWQQRVIRTFISENEHDHEVGQKLPVFYSPNDSAKVTIGTAKEIYVGLFILAVVAGVVTMLGAVGWHTLRKESVAELVASSKTSD